MSFQTIIIVGHLGRDPEMRYTPAGQAVTNFNLAANRQYTDSSGQVVKETTWFRVSAWGKTAENCNQYPPGWLAFFVFRGERQHSAIPVGA
jgi:single-strand DNA-binding protein